MLTRFGWQAMFCPGITLLSAETARRQAGSANARRWAAGDVRTREAMSPKRRVPLSASRDEQAEQRAGSQYLCSATANRRRICSPRGRRIRIHSNRRTHWSGKHIATLQARALEQAFRLYPQKRSSWSARYYTGLTSDVRARLVSHNEGRCRHTISGRPWQVDVVIEFADERRAIAFERYLKSGSGNAFANRHFRIGRGS